MANFVRQNITIYKNTGTSPVVQTSGKVFSMPITLGVGEVYSDELALSLQFPADFNGSPVAPKLWKCSGVLKNLYTLNAGNQSSYTQPVTGSASSIATAAIKSKLSDCYLPGYTAIPWEGTDKFIGYIYLQMKAADGAAAYDSDEMKRPLILNVLFERGDVNLMDGNIPVGKLSDLAMLSNWDLYYITDAGEEQLIGYIENSIGLSELMEKAELLTGMPQAVIHSTITRVGAEITGNLQTFDPAIQALLGNYRVQNQDKLVNLSQYNVFQSIPKRHFILRGQNVDGHLVEIHIPNGQLQRDGDVSLGGTEYNMFGFRITANADDDTGETHRWTITRAPVQVESLVIHYSGA